MNDRAVDDLHPAVRPAAVIDVTRRQAEVLGGGPRIGPMPVEALNGDLLAIIERMIEVNDRSEEHTSELQSLMRISYAVLCLKKNKLPHNTTAHTHKLPTSPYKQ